MTLAENYFTKTGDKKTNPIFIQLFVVNKSVRLSQLVFKQLNKYRI